MNPLETLLFWLLLGFIAAEILIWFMIIFNWILRKWDDHQDLKRTTIIKQADGSYITLPPGWKYIPMNKKESE